MFYHSLKTKFALVIIVLQTIVTMSVLLLTSEKYFEDTTKMRGATEDMLLNLVSEISRSALITSEFGELQPFAEKVVTDPQVEKLILLDEDNRIMVSSDVTEIGSIYTKTPLERGRFWRFNDVINSSGRLGSIGILYSHISLIQSHREVKNLGITTAFIGILCISVFGVVFGFLLTRRLGVLASTAKQIANGDLAAKSKLKGKDEVAIVGEALDTMGKNIQIYVEKLRDAQDKLEVRVMQRTQELAIARDQALEASKAKSSFLANMSHELRTPLNAIIGYGELLIEDAEELHRRSNMADLCNIKSAAYNLLNLIDDILDLAKIEAGKLDIHNNTIYVAEFLHGIQTTFQPIINKNNNQLRIEIQPDVEKLVSDRNKLQQILVNLISNAGKFTHEGLITVKVTLRIEGDTQWVDFKVTDTGIGISTDNLTKLFDNFYQVDDSASRKFGGAGLGLSICNRLANAMHGKLFVKSELGKGSSFTLSLPKEIYTLLTC